MPQSSAMRSTVAPAISSPSSIRTGSSAPSAPFSRSSSWAAGESASYHSKGCAPRVRKSRRPWSPASSRLPMTLTVGRGGLIQGRSRTSPRPRSTSSSPRPAPPSGLSGGPFSRWWAVACLPGESSQQPIPAAAPGTSAGGPSSSPAAGTPRSPRPRPAGPQPGSSRGGSSSEGVTVTIDWADDRRGQGGESITAEGIAALREEIEELEGPGRWRWRRGSRPPAISAT